MKTVSTFVLIIVVTACLSGCALFDFNEDNPSYKGGDDISDYSAQKNGTAEAYDELGLSPSIKLSPDAQEALEKRVKLKHFEHGISTVREREQYYEYKAYLDNDDERMTFLSIPSIEGRDRYAMQKGIYFKTNKFTPRVKNAVSRSDIVLGMTKDAVMESWGEPESIEVAGSQMFGNERWRYTEYLSTPEGYQKEERMVIFESGKVVGWQKF
jgi:outer membrane protein assembly factor BamE (lipoprotein component of BamABCDE complex)